MRCCTALALMLDGSTEMGAVKVEKSSVSDATFAPPAGYKAMSVPAGMRQH